MKRPQIEARIRLPGDQIASSLSTLDLLDQYWKTVHAEDRNVDVQALQKLAREIISEDEAQD